MKREQIPTEQVLAWLHATHPVLIESVELDRSWVWLANVDLREQPDVRKSIKDYGFVFARRGHSMPSGTTAYWGHSCNAPLPFKRRDKPQRTKPKPEPWQQQQRVERFDPLAPAPARVAPPVHQAAGPVDHSTLDPELLAWIS